MFEMRHEAQSFIVSESLACVFGRDIVQRRGGCWCLWTGRLTQMGRAGIILHTFPLYAVVLCAIVLLPRARPTQSGKCEGEGAIKTVESSNSRQNKGGVKSHKYFGTLALRGGKRDRAETASPFSILHTQGMSAKTKIRELHTRQSQTQREAAMELARAQARQAMLAAQVVHNEVADCVAPPSTTSSDECPLINNDRGWQDARGAEKSSEVKNDTALTLARTAHLHDKSADSWWNRRVEVYIPEEAQGCIRSTMLHFSQSSPSHLPFPAHRPCQEMVLYRPLAPRTSPCSRATAHGREGAQDRAVPNDYRASRVKELPPDEQEQQLNTSASDTVQRQGAKTADEMDESD